MKRKIITTSTSCLSGNDANEEIEIIPDVIQFSDIEAYNDSIDYLPEMLFNRLSFDRYANPRVVAQKVFYIIELLRRLMAEGYESFIFIIPASEILDYKTNITIASSKLKCTCLVYESSFVGFPMAKLALEANKMLNEDMPGEEIIAKLKEIDSQMGLFILSYKKDLDLKIGTNISELDLNTLDNKGKLYKMENGRLLSIKHDKSKAPALALLELFLKEIEGTKSVPFIMSSSSSEYKVILESKLCLMYEGLKNIDSYSMPSIFSTRLGRNILALGYIKRD